MDTEVEFIQLTADNFCIYINYNLCLATIIFIAGFSGMEISS